MKRLHPTVRCGIVAVSVLLSTVMACADTVDGFVTETVSPVRFAIGSLSIRLSEKTQCELQLVKNPLVVVPTAYISHNAEHGAQLDYSNTLPSAEHPAAMMYDTIGRHAVSVPCSSEPLRIGSRVMVAGRIAGSAMEADRLVVFKFQYKKNEFIRDGTLVEESPQLQSGPQGWHGTAWLDGYPVIVAPETQVVSVPASTRFSYGYGWSGGLNVGTSVHGPKLAVAPSAIQPDTWTAFIAQSTSGGTLVAQSIQVWPNASTSGASAFLHQFMPQITPPIFDRHVPGTIQFRNAPSIPIIPDQAVQNWVAQAGAEILATIPAEDYAKESGVRFRFFVVGTVPSLLGDYFIPVAELTRRTELVLRKEHTWFQFTRAEKKANMPVRSVVASPDGTVMIPDMVLAALQNKAQLVALLSYVIAAVVQRQSYRSFPPIMVPSRIERNALGTLGTHITIAMWLNGEAIRIGIHRMYLAGYDIREAPYAWSAAAGIPIRNPQTDVAYPKSAGQIHPWYAAYVFNYSVASPWYTAYAFNYISQFYSDVDYSKLKRGEREYAQFLAELRKADPDAFEQKK